MPEITLPGLREVGNGPSEKLHELLKEMRSNGLCLWTHEGTEEECEDSWRKFLLDGTPDWVIFSE